MEFRLKEGDVLNSVCEYLKFQGVFFWRNNTVGIYDAARKSFRSPPKYSMKGVPDVIAIIEGYFVGFEVKRPKRGGQAKTYQSKEQKDFEALVVANKGYYFVVRSVDDARLALTEIISGLGK